MPSYEELAVLVAEQAVQLAEQAVLIEALRVELEALRRQAGRDSANSSQPPSTDGPAAKAKAKAARRPAGEQAGPSPEGPVAGEPGRGRARRKQGGQPGHHGSGLAPVATPDHREPVEPACCAGCGGDLAAGAPATVGRRVQVFDLPSFSLAVTEYLLMRRLCGCGHATMAGLPAGVRGGPTCYGPNVTAAATLLASQDVLGIERTADLMSALLGVEVSTGFISSCLTRLDTALTTAGFEQALKTALRGQEVLGTDETPAPLTDAASSEPDCHNPHVYTVRTMGAYTRGGADLVWYGAAGDRTKTSISGFGILDDFRGVLVRDDYGGYTSYDDDLAGVQQCLAHVIRYLDDAYAIDTDAQAWARQAADALRGAIHEVNTTRVARPGHPRRRPAHPAAAPLRPGGGGRHLHEPVPALAQGQPSRPATGQTAQAQGPPGVAVHHPTRRSSHEQRLGVRDPRVQTRRQGPRLLAHPGHPAAALPDPFLPGQRPQPRTPAHRRHPRCPDRQPVDATPGSMIHFP